MKLLKHLSLVAIFLVAGMGYSQEEEAERVHGHYNNNSF